MKTKRRPQKQDSSKKDDLRRAFKLTREEELKIKSRKEFEILKIYKRLKKNPISLKELEKLNTDLMEQYMEFLYTKTTNQQILDICSKRTINAEIFLNIIKLAIGSGIDDLSTIPSESKSCLYCGKSRKN